MKVKNGKPLKLGQKPIVDCQIRAVDFCGSRNQLVAVYTASKKSLGAGPELDLVVIAIKARSAVLAEQKI